MLGDRSPFAFALCGLAELPAAVGRFAPTHAISITDPTSPHLPAFPASTRVLRLSFWDVRDLPAGQAAWLSPAERALYPAAGHARAILDFGAGLPRQPRVLIHCWAGFSRSAAAAYLLLCQRMPGGERRALRLLRRRRPGADPNRMIVGFGDHLLGRGGSMQAALEERPGLAGWLRARRGSRGLPPAPGRGEAPDPLLL